jgi:hypothetical protein
MLRKTLLAGAALLGFATASANAALITSLAQESSANTVVATSDGTTTNLSIASGTLVTLGGGAFNVAGASFQLAAQSIDAAQLFGGLVIQHFSGTFCVSSIAGCGGNFLSGTFTDAAFGAIGGPGLTVQVSNPPEQLVLTSNVVPAEQLLAPSSFNLTFVNLSNPLAVDGNTIGAFTASFTGDVSASSVPEPASLAVLGAGMVGIGLTRRRRATATEMAA